MYLIIYFAILLTCLVHSSLSSSFLAIGTLIMSYLLFALFCDMRINTEGRFYKIIKDISKMSFGIYLIHIFIYDCITIEIFRFFGTYWWIQICVMMINFISAYGVTKAISYFRYSKYLIG